MIATQSSAYARLPTFSAVIDAFASGLGLARNKEDALEALGSFSGRIDAYSGSPNRPGLQQDILVLLTGSNEVLRRVVKARLLDAESALTNTRAVPLVTLAKECEGWRRFVEVWAIPWITELLNDAGQYPRSVLDSARRLLETHAACGGDTKSYLVTWKAAIKRAIPQGVSAPEFRSILARLDHRSQRKLTSIETDLVNLRQEIQNEIPTIEALDADLEKIRHIYIAGIATMRLFAAATKIMPEHDLPALITAGLKADINVRGDSPREVYCRRVHVYWNTFDPGLERSLRYEKIYCEQSPWNHEGFSQLRTENAATDPDGLWLPAIDFTEGYWHLCHGRNDYAKQCLQRIVDSAGGRQLGEIAALAASFLIALRLNEPKVLKFEMLNPLVRIRIDNISQRIEPHLDHIPTPFSARSPWPDPSFYDQHLMASVIIFNALPRIAGVPLCNPLRRFDAMLLDLIKQSGQAGTRFSEAARNRPAIEGTSVKPYQLLRDHLYYRDVLFGRDPSKIPHLPGMDNYCMLPEDEKLRLLRFVDPEQFKKDLQSHDWDKAAST
ncbi:hypothetical protein [Bordetella genomosp. 11]|uniref:Uncharacterized protein n=1 Tax=Bordetella genomosp. 11 TaxID=1416808 RepID=A0A261UMW8_9BORD|nr:hypothetical protein [Bordetella genomosp. 11]OZI63209.1 hypothetical protein CAL28_29440 [Bordetella genomosp. 11]